MNYRLFLGLAIACSFVLLSSPAASAQCSGGAYSSGCGVSYYSPSCASFQGCSTYYNSFPTYSQGCSNYSSYVPTSGRYSSAYPTSGYTIAPAYSTVPSYNGYVPSQPSYNAPVFNRQSGGCANGMCPQRP